jgi:predicted flavoprotein YhiN
VLTVPAPKAAAQLPRFERKGEFVITDTGLEGSLVYAASAWLRDDLDERGQACLLLDLLPDKTPEKVLKDVAWPRGSRSLSSHLKSRLGLDGAKMGLLFELCPPETLARPEALAAIIKALPVPLKRARPVAEAISTAGGVALQALGPDLMLSDRPGVFCAGEMLDWEAPTGGYLLTACLASGHRAAQGVLRGLAAKSHTI